LPGSRSKIEFAYPSGSRCCASSREADPNLFHPANSVIAGKQIQPGPRKIRLL
jgi:hypothetical protein